MICELGNCQIESNNLIISWQRKNQAGIISRWLFDSNKLLIRIHHPSEQSDNKKVALQASPRTKNLDKPPVHLYDKVWLTRDTNTTYYLDEIKNISSRVKTILKLMLKYLDIRYTAGHYRIAACLYFKILKAILN